MQLQDSKQRFEAQGLKLAAISYDSPAILKDFAKRHKIEFPLLSDANSEIIRRFNVLNTEILREAQKHPEKYRDLVVRVAGFSAFFTKLHVGVQNEIIERTLQSFGKC